MSQVDSSTAVRWSQFTDHLRQQGPVVVLTYAELERIVGGLPPSASRHRAWWSGARPQVRAWQAAGYGITQVDLGRQVTFTRADGAPSDVTAVTPDLVLVSCVKSKRPVEAPARELYVSPLFRGERVYAESTGVPWFILSAEHGLLAPDDVVEPYERYLPNQSPDYRRQWGARVIDQIEGRYGDVAGRVVEIHAGAVYVSALAPGLAGRGAEVVDRLRGLTMGQRLAWYARSGRASRSVPEADMPLRQEVPSEIAPLVTELSDGAAALTPAAFLDAGPSSMRVPGLYSWWVDEDGARDLSSGLGATVRPGLIYAGLAGATRWPSGKRSRNTLWSRISGMHLGRNARLSTLRLSLMAVLSAAGVVPMRGEEQLTAWMGAHLRVRAQPYADPDALGRVEEAVLAALDPPLNLRGMPPSPVRVGLSGLRRAVPR